MGGVGCVAALRLEFCGSEHAVTRLVVWVAICGPDTPRFGFSEWGPSCEGTAWAGSF